MNVVIPAYNAVKTINRVVTKCLKYTPRVLVVDDGSKDGTAYEAQRSGAGVYCHTRNWGVGGATMSGLSITRDADIVVVLDADLQHDPDEIPKLIEPIQKGLADVVIGSRFLLPHKIPTYRKFGIWVITLAYNFGHKPITDAQSGFRAYSRKFLDSIKLEDNGFAHSTEILIKARKQYFRIVEVPISCIYHNLEQDSHSNPIKHGLSVLLKTIYWRIREWN